MIDELHCGCTQQRHSFMSFRRVKGLLNVLYTKERDIIILHNHMMYIYFVLTVYDGKIRRGKLRNDKLMYYLSYFPTHSNTLSGIMEQK